MRIPLAMLPALVPATLASVALARVSLVSVALVSVTLPSFASAEEQPVVVELFTAQGCSSCPPADAILADVARMEGVIALSLHVDYWDYIGWADSFGSPAHTARQEAYARVAHERMVYTPQVIVNGQDRVVGNDVMGVMDRLRDHSGATTPVSLDLTRDGASLKVEATADAPMPPLIVHLVRFAPSRSVAIEDGENAGLQMTYSHVVTSWEVVGEWTGEEPLNLTLAVPGREPAVVLLQEEGPGRIMAAAEVR